MNTDSSFVQNYSYGDAKEQVEREYHQCLDAINQQMEDYDCVVIIRGGGATADLSG